MGQALFLGGAVAGNPPYANAKVEGRDWAFRTGENSLDIGWLPPDGNIRGRCGVLRPGGAFSF